jgi:hypothetical protein
MKSRDWLIQRLVGLIITGGGLALVIDRAITQLLR